MERDLTRCHELDLAGEAYVLRELFMGEGIVLEGGGGGEEVVSLGDGDHASRAVASVAPEGDGGVGWRGVLEEIDKGRGWGEGVGAIEDGERGHGRDLLVREMDMADEGGRGQYLVYGIMIDTSTAFH